MLEFLVSDEPSDFSADVIFLMDSTSDVDEQDYIVEKNYVKSMAMLLNLGPRKTRVALYVYSYYTKSLASFEFDNRQAFAAIVNEAPHLGGSRRIDLALEAAVQLLKTRSRSSVPKFVVLITAGAQARAPNVKSLSVLAKSLRDQGARLFVIGIRPRFDVRELLSAVETRADIFPVTSYTGLLPAATPMARHMMASWGM